VQIVEPLPGGGSLKLTVAKYYTPAGRCIQAVDYGGGRLEASAKGKSAYADMPAAGAAGVSDEGPLDPATPPLRRDPAEAPSPAKKSGGGAGGGASKSATPTGPDIAGGVMRIDDRDPSRPKAAAGEEKSVYVTDHGRAVKAGGGIGPDVLVEGRTLGELERSLLSRGLFFDFSGEWLRTHAAPIDVLAERVDTQQEDAYREFVSYVKARIATDDTVALAPPGVVRQLDSLQKTIEKQSKQTGAPRERSLRELATLRRQLNDEQLDEFRTQKAVLKDDLIESLLGRLTPPSVRLAAQLGSDPQVASALKLAKDVAKYETLLAPDPALLDDSAKTTADGLKIVRRPPLAPLPTAGILFPSDKVAATR